MGGKVSDTANLNHEYFALGRLGFFTSIPESQVANWMGSFLDVRDVVDHAGDDDLEALAELYGIEVEDED